MSGGSPLWCARCIRRSVFPSQIQLWEYITTSALPQLYLALPPLSWLYLCSTWLYLCSTSALPLLYLALPLLYLALPGSTSALPPLYLALPLLYLALPGSTWLYLCSTSALPGSTSALPGSTSALPGSTWLYLCSTSALPGSTWLYLCYTLLYLALPGSTSTLPGSTSALLALPGSTWLYLCSTWLYLCSTWLYLCSTSALPGSACLYLCSTYYSEVKGYQQLTEIEQSQLKFPVFRQVEGTQFTYTEQLDSNVFRTSQLVKTLIAEARMEYSGDEWLGYDRRFGQWAEANPGTVWARIDPMLRNIVFAGQGCTTGCRYCFSLSHQSEDCDWGLWIPKNPPQVYVCTRRPATSFSCP